MNFDLWVNKNRKTILYLAIGALVYSFVNIGKNPEVPIITQAIFGFSGATITVGILLLGVGIALAFSPAAAFSPILFILGGIMLSGGALFSQLGTFFSNSYIWVIIAFGLFIFYMIFRKGK